MDAPAAKPKEKTKAKLKYLKRKKERKKAKKSSAAKKPAPGSKTWEDGEDEEAEEAEDKEMEAVEEPPPAEETTRKPKKKRRKLEEAEPVNDDEMDVDEPPEARNEEKKIQPPTILPALPVFPQIRTPNAPLKSDLALQGLEKGLFDAEIIDSRTTFSLNTTDKSSAPFLGERMKKRLDELGISELFAVQTALLPFLLSSNENTGVLRSPYDPPQDICVSAPTGSGKTLAYVVPILEILSSRIVTRLRALIVLPTRDLVNQVRETCEAVGKGRGLKIGTATGQHSFAHEQAQLVEDKTSPLQGGSSKVDILICTPGRLMDHINGTPNFSLQHLRFLVIDEADRLLGQSFQDWLAQVLAAIRVPTKPVELSHIPSNAPYSDAVNLAFFPPEELGGFGYVPERMESTCQKLLFSATLTRDPEKIAVLQLRRPKYFVVQDTSASNPADGVLNVVMEKFSVPSTLTEHMVVCDSAQKPLMFFNLIFGRSVTNALVFTKSTESTTRLVQLFQFFSNSLDSSQSTASISMQAYSSDLPVSERRSILDKFKSQEIHILVCSDLISRGIDIDHVSHVVNYDVPVDIRKYIHRVGRTARAGRSGDAWTLVENQEARYFKNMLKETDHLSKVQKLKVGSKELEQWQPHYEVALKRLQDHYSH